MYKISSLSFFKNGGQDMSNITTMINKMTFKERDNSKYEGRLTINGVRKSFYGTTKAEVKQKAKEYLTKIENGYKEPKKIVFDDFAMYWLKTYKWNKIEPTSYSRLYSIYVHHIQEPLGKKKIGDITTKDIQQLIDEKANPTKSNEKALALSGLKKIIHFLDPCFRIAIQEGILHKNPCEYVILPKQSCVQVQPKEQFSLSDDEIQKLKDASFQTYKTTGEYRSRDAFSLLIILNLGLRVNEAVALLWSDFDLENRFVRINKTIQSNIIDFESTEKRRYRRLKTSTKTKSGMRVIPLNDSIIEYLNILREYDKRNNITSKYVVCTTSGTMHIEKNLQRSLDLLEKKTNIDKHITLHTLRHTFGSVMLRRGVNIEVVSKLMGHANISITYNKYIHTVQEEEAKAMNMVKIS